MKQHKTMRIEEKTIQFLDKQAKKERRSFNSLVDNILQDYVNASKMLAKVKSDSL